MKSYLICLSTLLSFLVLQGSTSVITQDNATTVYANDDNGKFSRNKPVEIFVTENDFGLESGIQSLTVSKSPIHGTAKSTSKATIIYTPSLNYLGDDKFEYTVCNSTGGCGTATVYIQVSEYDYQPVAINDTIIYINDPKKKQECNVLKNDINAWDEPLTVSIVTELVNGTVQVNANNTITPTFNNNFVGNDTLSYRVVDREGDSDTAMVFFEVIPKVVVIGADVPNGFSPNGDGVNDVFNIPDLDSYDELEISIFNQLGGLVYDDKAYLNNWNGISNTGKYSGMDLPSGTYYYLLQVKGTDTKITGFIYLSR